MCPAPKGHAKWGNPLKPKKYTPEQLWDGACNYFEWVDKHPWKKIEQKKGSTVISAKSDVKLSRKAIAGFIAIPTQRPYTIEGLCNFLDINLQTFINYSERENYETHFDVCARIRQIIDTQHFEGGMVGAFNSNIVTRKLGLVEKQEIQNKGDVEVTLEI